MASSLTELLDQALGSGDDAGAVNFNLLKDVLGSVLIKLEIENDPPRDQPVKDDKPSGIEKRLDDLGLVPLILACPRCTIACQKSLKLFLRIFGQYPSFS